MKVSKVGQTQQIVTKKGETLTKVSFFIVPEGQETGVWASAFSNNYLASLKIGDTIRGYHLEEVDYNGKKYFNLKQDMSPGKQQVTGDLAEIKADLKEIKAMLKTLMQQPVPGDEEIPF